MSYFIDLFDREFGPKLANRTFTFRKMFEILESKQQSFYTIVETGCARKKDNWAGDGQSSILFDKFLNVYDGLLHTVDLDPTACSELRKHVSQKTRISCSDSVVFLHQLVTGHPELKIDLLYLDSYDIDWSNPHPSSLHHLKELCAVKSALRPGTLIVVDDTVKTLGVLTTPMPDNKFKIEVFKDTGLIGKGVYVDDFLTSIGCQRIFEGYQVGYIYK
jgi:hypothetical protein